MVLDAGFWLLDAGTSCLVPADCFWSVTRVSGVRCQKRAV
ncbi:hypothetical protein D1AOALGA4SA_10790 [Olavius algarvensis Delta 1 endosymbiont]|nr:hypothetical protein D1AOALGA4SA_10790 [Olavius algarvensis Delta 1 endosymbiont]